MASRVYKAGTIVSRTKSMFEAGVLKKTPLWFDILEALPPINLTTHNHPPKPGKPPKITFPNDTNVKELPVGRNRNKVISLFGTHEEPVPTKIAQKQQEVIETAATEVGPEAGEPKEEASLTAAPPVHEKTSDKGLSPAEELLKFLTEVDSFDEQLKK